MKELRFAMIGTGFWSRYQLAGWRELTGATCAALCNRTRSKAEALAQEFNVPAVYADPDELIKNEQLDFLDIVTDVDTHARFVALAAKHKLPAICQKPMAPTLAEAERMVTTCREADVAFYIHENWRWQEPIRQLKRLLAQGIIGQPFRGRIHYANSFPVFDNQPFLKELNQFILTDMGSHILDVARFLFGEAKNLYCQIDRVHPDIRGEDVATVIMRMGGQTTVTCELSYASRTEHERFPQTYFSIEGERGSIELGPDYWIRVTTVDGTQAERYPPPAYAWAAPTHAVVHASIVACNADILRSLQGGPEAETNGADNLKTMRLIFAAYESAQTGRAIELD